ncbi:MAG: hypothetical protein EPO52_17635 [Herbiconiux sp.]|uniref:DUF6093 family protein n=1 Tax=Herbiconiux sp. TaxID=1871186 RepID=UPI001202D8D7|nr:DUF6093 family protein [Herbiconiux sp.]TAJ46355.1 MAG: hypothetical protein EPO52_17635 [Herbiconiux sp.]
MTLGDDLDAALPELRRQAESMMRDSCTIATIVKGAWDEITLTHSVDVETVHYSGPCKLKGVNAVIGTVDAASQILVAQEAIVSLPVGSSTTVDRGMVLTITECRHDPALVGAKVTIGGPTPLNTYSTARRFRIEEVA